MDGRFAYWIDDLIDVRSTADALSKLGTIGWDVEIQLTENIWAVCSNGVPQFWFDSLNGAEEASNSLGGAHWSISYYEKIWRLMYGDQYLFATTNLAEVEGVALGILVEHFVGNRGHTSD